MAIAACCDRPTRKSRSAWLNGRLGSDRQTASTPMTPSRPTSERGHEPLVGLVLGARDRGRVRGSLSASLTNSAAPRRTRSPMIPSPGHDRVGHDRLGDLAEGDDGPERRRPSGSEEGRARVGRRGASWPARRSAARTRSRSSVAEISRPTSASAGHLVGRGAGLLVEPGVLDRDTDVRGDVDSSRRPPRRTGRLLGALDADDADGRARRRDRHARGTTWPGSRAACADLVEVLVAIEQERLARSRIREVRPSPRAIGSCSARSPPSQ